MLEAGGGEKIKKEEGDFLEVAMVLEAGWEKKFCRWVKLEAGEKKIVN